MKQHMSLSVLLMFLVKTSGTMPQLLWYFNAWDADYI